jgi:hypothetical protein
VVGTVGAVGVGCGAGAAGAMVAPVVPAAGCDDAIVGVGIGVAGDMVVPPPPAFPQPLTSVAANPIAAASSATRRPGKGPAMGAIR